MEIIQERLEREFDLNIVTTAPSVIYKIKKKDGTIIEIQNPTNMPEETEIEYMEEESMRNEAYMESHGRIDYGYGTGAYGPL
jgi:GTP-binding protein LepA